MRAKPKKDDTIEKFLKGMSKVSSVFLKGFEAVLRRSFQSGIPAVTPQPDARAVPSTIIVERSYPGGDPVTERTLEIKPFVTSPASVTAGFGLTIPLAAYASGRVYVQVTLPCYKEELDATLLVAKGMVEREVTVEAEKIYSKRDELSGQARPGGGPSAPGESHTPEVPGA